jgi:hypothetical protein
MWTYRQTARRKGKMPLDYKKIDGLNAKAVELAADIKCHMELATSFGGQLHKDIVERRYTELKKVWQELIEEKERAGA